MEENETLKEDRNSLAEFFENRDWTSITNFWYRLMNSADELPDFISGNDEYGITNLQVLHDLGEDEFASNDPRFKRQTFALRLGYHGTSYQGYQMQKGVEGVRTVEGDVMLALGGRTSVAAGRTDRDVSAVSQIISFSTYDLITATDIIEKMRASEPVLAGRLAVYDAVRVPKRFQALFSATWRRYIYLFPLNTGTYLHDVDVDVAFVDRCLRTLEGLVLHYNGFAYREDRGGGEATRSDECILYRSRASLVSLQPEMNTNSTANNSGETNSSVRTSKYALCVELVGSRFLRRMVRILVATVVRESVRETTVRNEDILLHICHSGKRDLASLAVSGVGLAIAGVGYALEADNAGNCQGRKHPTVVATVAVNVGMEMGVGKGEGKDSTKSQDPVQGPSKKDRRVKKKRKSSDEHVHLDIESFKHELSSYTPDLLYFPQRRFEFSPLCTSSSVSTQGGTINNSDRGQKVVLVNQNIGDVGFTCWDAEVILAHYMHTFLVGRQQQNNSLNILELGAGSAIAAIACLQHNDKTVTNTDNIHNDNIRRDDIPLSTTTTTTNNNNNNICPSSIGSDQASMGCVSVAVQELAHVLPFTLDSLAMNNVRATRSVAAVWGEECVRLACGGDELSWDDSSSSSSSSSSNTTGRSSSSGSSDNNKMLYDLVIMADVLYHVEDFQPLIDTIVSCLNSSGAAIICYEQRRRDLSPFFKSISSRFSSNNRHEFTVTQEPQPDERETESSGDATYVNIVPAPPRTTTFFIHELYYKHD